MNNSAILRPTLLVDREKCLQNILWMKGKAEKSGCRFRPHFKTHQSSTVGKWFASCGAQSITVSSIGMAEYFAASGWSDITIAFPLNIRELDAVRELASKINLHVLVNSRETMQSLSASVHAPVGFFIEMDNGYGRSGIDMQNTGEISRLLEIAEQHPHILFRGFLSHFGDTYDAATTEQVRTIFNKGKAKLLDLKEKFLRDFPGIIISAGDTPGCSLVDDFSGLDEIRPGNFVYYDLVQYRLGSCRSGQVAAVVACPVVEVQEERSQLIIYGGAVHFSKDYVLIDGRKVFGCGVQLQENTWGEPDLSLQLVKVSQEHGIVAYASGMKGRFRPGDLVYLIPAHSCLAANLLNAQTIEGERLDLFRV